MMARRSCRPGAGFNGILNRGKAEGAGRVVVAAVMRQGMKNFIGQLLFFWVGIVGKDSFAKVLDVPGVVGSDKLFLNKGADFRSTPGALIVLPAGDDIMNVVREMID